MKRNFANFRVIVAVSIDIDERRMRDERSLC